MDSPSPTVSPTEELITPSPTEVYFEEDPRSVYDGSISDTYLRELSAYYNTYARAGTPYNISRPSQYVYQLVFGDSSDSIHFTNATIVTLNIGYYNSNNTISVSLGGNTINVDVGGSNAYIFCSNDNYLPSPYITDSPRFLTYSVIFLCALIFVVSLARFLWSLIRR